MEAAAYAEAVLPRVAHRRWTFSLPLRLRFLVVTRPALLKRLEVRLVQAVWRRQRRAARPLGQRGMLASDSLRTARGWDGANALQAAAFERAARLSASLVVTGLLQAPLQAVGAGPLTALGWTITQVELWPGLCGGPASRRVEGDLENRGRFRSPAQDLREGSTAEARLRPLAERSGTTLKARQA